MTIRAQLISATRGCASQPKVLANVADLPTISPDLPTVSPDLNPTIHVCVHR